MTYLIFEPLNALYCYVFVCHEKSNKKAQGLRSAITTLSKLYHNASHRAYIMRSEDMGDRSVSQHDEECGELESTLPSNLKRKVPLKVLGLLKVGRKNLFVNVRVLFIPLMNINICLSLSKFNRMNMVDKYKSHHCAY